MFLPHPHLEKYADIPIKATQRENIGSLIQVHWDHFAFCVVGFYKIHPFKVYNSMLFWVFYTIVQRITSIQFLTMTLNQTKRFCTQK